MSRIDCNSTCPNERTGTWPLQFIDIKQNSEPKRLKVTPKKLYKKRFKQNASLLNIGTIATARAPMSAPAHGYSMVLILIQYSTIRLKSGLAGIFQCHRRLDTLSRIQKDKTRDH